MLDGPLTTTGALRCVVNVSPICPELFNPHATSTPSLRIAALKLSPAAIALTCSEGMSVGVEALLVVPRPS